MVSASPCKVCGTEMCRQSLVFLAGDPQPTHEQGQRCRHIPAPSPGSAVLLLHPSPASDTPCSSQTRPFGVIPGLGCAPADPGELWDPPSGGNWAALGQLPAPRWERAVGASGVWRDPTPTPAWGSAPFQSPATGAGWGLHCPSTGGSRAGSSSQANPARYLQGGWASKNPWFSCSNPS